MMQNLPNLNTLGQASGLRDNTKTYSIAMGVVSYSPSRCFRTLFDNSVLVTVLTIGLLFGLFPTPISAATSTYSGALNSGSPEFTRPYGTPGQYHYYQAIQVTVSATGTYTFISTGSMDTFGCFYSYPFNQYSPTQNLMAYDDDGAGINNQFRINTTLQSGRTYVLVVTTYSQSTTGTFSITANGPSSITLSPPLSPSTTTPPPPISSSYSGTLSSSSPRFSRPNGGVGSSFYYQAIQMTIYSSGAYRFTSISSIDTYGCIYNYPFDPYVPSQNLITCDDDGGAGSQFLINFNLQYGRSYVLVVTTFSQTATGSFSISVSGPGLTPTPSTGYSTTLYSSSPIFFRPNGNSGQYYYYQAIQATTYTSGTYSFSTSSSIDTYGCFYYYPFDPSYPSSNLIKCDDDSGGGNQFQINATLQSSNTYVLVVTTYYATTTGSISIRVLGPASVSLMSYTPSTSRPITSTSSNDRTMNTLKIVGISVGCVIVFAAFLGVCIHVQKQKSTPRQQTISSGHNQSGRTQIHPTVYANRNAPRANENQGPYTVTMSPVYGEEAPPSYDAFISTGEVRKW